MRLAVIPARGGSKRIPRKNIIDFAGRPMIAWPISAALEAGCFDKIVVSTDDPEIAEIARASGAETPFVRPPELSDDYAGTAPVIAHAIEQVRAGGDAPELVCCIYPATPLLDAAALKAGHDAIAADPDIDFTFCAAPFQKPVQRSLYLDGDGRPSSVMPGHEKTRTQDLPPAYYDAGQFYWGRAAAWTEGRPIFGPRSRATVVDGARVIDIDTPDDLELAKRAFAELRGG